ncbi:MAG: D-alanyl-D-alanine carboxypeptidase/D-alanyl-D-alanine-endopeptidase, partial [Gemmatimonadota bacterium]|nr:D-alanyl-D-alanine carboxypeptidase/D-alanyl-D-alanine-endopeptidase [Gemmatimonadota bacterium]
LHPDLSLAPASNLKLWSTAAALHYLGADFRFTTELWADGPVREGVLHGDVVLHGTGDPAISTRMLGGDPRVWDAFADSLRALGVREVRGDVVGDGSRWDRAWTGRGWNPADRSALYAAPVGALAFADNVFTVHLAPGSSPGSPATLRTTPATAGIAIANRVRTVGGARTALRWEHGADSLIVSGEIGAGSGGTARTLPVVDPANFAAAALRASLERRGISVRGATRSRYTPTVEAGRARLLAIHLSPPVREVIRVTNHLSHNGQADALLKAAAYVATGTGSWEGGEHAVRVLATEARADSAALRLFDGSGLSRLNRLTARGMVQLLAFMDRSPEAAPFYASLPVAGDPQGLRRMAGTPAAGNLRAKTGTIRGVSALSGYVRSADGERLAFSIIVNEVPSTADAKRIEDRFGERLAAFRRGR